MDEFLVNASWQRTRGGVAVTRTGSAPDVSAYVTEFNTDHPTTELRANVELRKLDDGRVFLGVLVRSGADTILSWSNIGEVRVDPSPHEVTVLEELCAALESQLTAGPADGGADADALAAGRLLLSSAAYQRARTRNVGEVQS